MVRNIISKVLAALGAICIVMILCIQNATKATLIGGLILLGLSCVFFIAAAWVYYPPSILRFIASFNCLLAALVAPVIKTSFTKRCRELKLTCKNYRHFYQSCKSTYDEYIKLIEEGEEPK